jgi:plastocyanin
MRVMMRAARLTVAALALMVLGLASSANAAPAAATQSVSIVSSAFSPKTISITVGDSVKWTNGDGFPHTVTADAAGSFNSTVAPNGGTFTLPFNSVGTFAYHCAIHTFMTGTVVVRAAATTPPTPSPTPVPTPVPTPQPTVAPTPQPTVAATLGPTDAPAPTITPTPTAAPATTAPAAVASPTTAPATEASRATTVAPQDGVPAPVIAVGAVVVIAGLGALAWVLRRR